MRPAARITSMRLDARPAGWCRRWPRTRRSRAGGAPSAARPRRRRPAPIWLAAEPLRWYSTGGSLPSVTRPLNWKPVRCVAIADHVRAVDALALHRRPAAQRPIESVPSRLAQPTLQAEARQADRDVGLGAGGALVEGGGVLDRAGPVGHQQQHGLAEQRDVEGVSSVMRSRLASGADVRDLVARDGQQVVADQRVFDGARHVGRQRAQHGAPGRRRNRPAAPPPTWPAGAARPCNARSARAGPGLRGLQRAFAEPVPVAHVEGHAQRRGRRGRPRRRRPATRAACRPRRSGRSRSRVRRGVSASCTLRPHSEPCDDGAEAADRHLQPRRAERGGGRDAARERRAVEPAALGPQAFGAGIHATARPGQRRQFGAGIAQQLAAHFDAVGAGGRGKLRDTRAGRGGRISAAPKDDREIKTCGIAPSARQCAWCELRIWPRNWRVFSCLRIAEELAAAAPARRSCRRP